MALVLNGVDQLARLPYTAWANTNSPASIAIKCKSAAYSGAMLSLADTDGSGTIMYFSGLFSGADNAVAGRLRSGATSPIQAQATGIAPTVDEWQTLVVTFDGVDTVRLYQPGQPIVSATATPYAATATELLVGAISGSPDGFTPTAFFSGKVAIARAWSRQLSDAEAAAYNSATSIAEVNAITGGFGADLISDATATDATTATLEGAPTFDADTPFAVATPVPGIPGNTLEYQGSPVAATTATISVHAGTDLKATSDFRVTGVALTSGVFSAIDLSGTTIAVGDPIVIEALPSEGPGIILRTTAGDIA